MPVRRRTYDDLHARYEAQVAKTATAETNRDASTAAAARTARRYNALAQVVAVHIVTAEENGVDISPATLRAALQRARLNLAIEYARAGRDGDQP
ncbi:hypothetical protein ACFXKC_28315 [Streptomyces sp. NPDC059340]|uniref:hypothetical protein n=1 Tax=Streptomyces sp. NPDC059340 TaxID=3346806 RepID=UPI00369A68D7